MLHPVKLAHISKTGGKYCNLSDNKGYKRFLKPYYFDNFSKSKLLQEMPVLVVSTSE